MEDLYGCIRPKLFGDGRERRSQGGSLGQVCGKGRSRSSF